MGLVLTGRFNVQWPRSGRVQDRAGFGCKRVGWRVGIKARDKPSAKLQPVYREPPVKFRASFREIPAKMPKRKKSHIEPQKPLDAFSEKRRRGRPGVRPAEVVLRAENYRKMFCDYRLDTKKKEYVRDKPSEWAMQLLASRNSEDAERAIQTRSLSVQNEFRNLIPLILRVLNERTFPKKSETQLDFLADSIAARGDVAPRTSRDICARERTEQRSRSKHHIIRHEFYIECSCGYKGPARDNACPKCNAEIPRALGFPFLS